MKQVSVKFYRAPPLIISLTGNRYVIKTFIIKLLLRLLNTRALSSFKDINRLHWREGENSSPPHFPHYSQRPVNGFVIMACLPRILSNCPPSRSKSLLYIRWPLSVLFSLLITHDEGPLHQIVARAGRFKTTWGSAARHPVLLELIDPKKVRYFSRQSMNAWNHQPTLPLASHGSLISVLLQCKVPQIRARHIAARIISQPAGQCALTARGLSELYGGGKLLNKDPEKERKIEEGKTAEKGRQKIEWIHLRHGRFAMKN